MTTPGGRRRAAPARTAVPWRKVAINAALVLLTGAAWIYLVRAAIDFGGLGKGGQGIAWLFAALATLGAIGCLLLTIVLVTRTLVAAGLITDHRPDHHPGHAPRARGGSRRR